jgi:hypothetical protein
MRWIVFDDDTAELVIGKFKRGATEIHYGEQPLDAVLRTRGRSLLLLPSANPGNVILARVENNLARPAGKSRVPVVAQFTPLRTVGRQSSLAPESPERRR